MGRDLSSTGGVFRNQGRHGLKALYAFVPLHSVVRKGRVGLIT